MICAGFGCKSNVSQEAVLAALDATLAHHGLAPEMLDALATVPRKGQEKALHEAAASRGLPLTVPADDALRTAAGQCLTISNASLQATQIGSAAEAAALAACGADARLLGPRFAQNGVTCAIATTGNEP